MAQQPPIGDIARKVTDEAFRTAVEIDLDTFYNRLLNEARTALAEFQKQGLTGDALADAVEARLQALADGPIEAMGRASTAEAFNLGRNLAAQENLALIQEAVRTEILDVNTCQPCRLLDGTKVKVNSPEYFQFMPPNLCDGRHNCRGFYLLRSAV
jgi:hypothetical protein